MLSYAGDGACGGRWVHLKTLSALSEVVSLTGKACHLPGEGRRSQCAHIARIGCALGSAADQARGQRPGELPPVQCRGDAGVEERVSGCTAGGQARLR